MQVPPKADQQAFGELFGFDMPTRYPEETHAFLNRIMAADSVITPVLTRMSPTTVWTCRALAGLLLLTSARGTGLALRTQLTIEATVGVALVGIGLLGAPRIPILERLYLIIGGVVMIGNAMMTQDDSAR